MAPRLSGPSRTRPKAIGGQSPVQAERDGSSRAERQQDRDWLGFQAAEAELQHACRGAVQPLRVVHGNHERCTARKEPERVQDSARQHPPLRLRPAGLGTDSRLLPGGASRSSATSTRSPARSRKRRQDLIGDVAEQIIECREDKRPLRQGGLAGQHPG